MAGATLMDVFNAGTRAAAPFLQHGTNRLREQNDLELRNFQARFATDLQNRIRDNPFNGNAESYHAGILKFADEKFSAARAANTSPHFQGNLDQMRTQTQELIRNHVLQQEDAWRIGQAQVQHGKDVDAFIDNLPPEQAWAAITQSVDLLRSQMPITPEQQHQMLEGYRTRLFQENMSRQMDAVTPDRNFTGTLDDFLRQRLGEYRLGFDFLSTRVSVLDEAGRATGEHEERPWSEGQREWEDRLVEFTKNRIQRESMERALTDYARFRRLHEEAALTGNSALSLQADAIARPYLNGSITEILRGVSPENQRFARNYSPSDQARLARLFQDPNAGGSGRMSDADLNREMDEVIRRGLTGEEEMFTLKDFWNTRGEWVEEFLQKKPGTDEFDFALERVSNNFMQRLANALNNNTLFHEQGAAFRRIQNMYQAIEAGLYETNGEVDPEFIRQLRNYVGTKAINMIVAFDFRNDQGRELDNRISAMEAEFIQMFTYGARPIRQRVVDFLPFGGSAEQRVWDLQRMMQEGTGALGFIDARSGERRQSPMPPELYENIQHLDLRAAEMIGAVTGANPALMQASFIPVGRSDRGINTHGLSNWRKYETVDGRHFRIVAEGEGRNISVKVQEGRYNRNTGRWEWDAGREVPLDELGPRPSAERALEEERLRAARPEKQALLQELRFISDLSAAEERIRNATRGGVISEQEGRSLLEDMRRRNAALGIDSLRH